MNKLAAFSVLLPLALLAADVWEAKPFTEWSDKDLQKVTSNSPWAKQARAVLNAAPAGAPGRARGRGNTGDSEIGEAPRGIGNQGGGVSDASRMGSAPIDIDPGPQALAAGLPIVIRWQTALPLRQAQMRGKYGKEAATSPEAQKFLNTEPTIYVIGVAGLPGAIVGAGGGDLAKDNILKRTTLTVKGRTAWRPVAVDLAPNGSAVDVLLAFPRANAITLEDQEVEFVSMIGTATVTYKWKLKDLLLHGKLEL
jgi:hypothetical protein